MDFSRMRLSLSERLRLLETQTECTVSWLNSDGWPVAAIQTFVWHHDALWVTSFRNRPRVALLAREPRSAVTVSSTGTALQPQQMASARTVATVHDEASVAQWFYAAFSRRVVADERRPGNGTHVSRTRSGDHRVAPANVEYVFWSATTRELTRAWSAGVGGSLLVSPADDDVAERAEVIGGGIDR